MCRSVLVQFDDDGEMVASPVKSRIDDSVFFLDININFFLNIEILRF